MISLGDCWAKRADFHGEPGVGGQTVWGASRGEDGVLNVFSKAFGPYPDVQFDRGPLAGVVIYDGQGLVGDQRMSGSNQWLLEAMENEDAVRFLYQAERDGEWCFVDWKRVWELHRAVGPDQNDDMRRVFKWILVPSDESGRAPDADLVEALEGLDLDSLDAAVGKQREYQHEAEPLDRSAGPDPFTDLYGFLQSLEGSTILTLLGRPNSVIRVDDNSVLVGTERSPSGEAVPVEDIRKASARLVQEGSVRISPDAVGYRSAFIGAVLKRFPRVEVETDPYIIRMRAGLMPSGAAEAAGVDLLANPRRTLSQGYVGDSRRRRAIEQYAVHRAVEEYESRGYEVTDVGSFESYDLRCEKPNEELHVEVKGSTTGAVTVHLTANEVSHNRSYDPTALFVVRNITVHDEGGSFECSDGDAHVIDEWTPSEDDLESVAYRYRVPGN